MAINSSKCPAGLTAAPLSLPFAVVSVGCLALFLVIASRLLVSNHIGSTINGYLLGRDYFDGRNHSSNPIGENQTKVLFRWQEPSEKGNEGMAVGEIGSRSEVTNVRAFDPTISFDDIQEVGSANNTVSRNGDEEIELGGTFSSGSIDDSRKNDSEIYSDGLVSSNLTLAVVPLPPPPPPPPSSNFGKAELRSCDLYHGKWIYDPAGPLYTNRACPILTQAQNCQGNGRPDKDYQNWRWKPDQCDLPRFDARKFLELMRGKTLAFVGDSLARNQMESMLCILWQVEAPKKRGNRQMHRWYFKSTSTTIVRIWSAWLVHRTTEPLPSTPHGLDKIHLDIPDETFMQFLPKFDVVVLSSGHWFSKQSAYLLNGTTVGGQLWHPNRRSRGKKQQIDSVKAYSVAVETVLTAIATRPSYTGLTIVRTYSPGHYNGGAWNAGGSCGRMVKPATKLVRNRHTEAMHKKQVTGFEQAAKKVANGSKMRLMDITRAFGYRHDGHPGPYSSPDSMKKAGSNGNPPSEDCVHWCMPGPVDTWNEILFGMIRREF